MTIQGTIEPDTWARGLNAQIKYSTAATGNPRIHTEEAQALDPSPGPSTGKDRARLWNGKKKMTDPIPKAFSGCYRKETGS
jgi:hypothetical protein